MYKLEIPFTDEIEPSACRVGIVRNKNGDIVIGGLASTDDLLDILQAVTETLRDRIQ